jgi:dTDP-4-dehydrorhamnose 3,5-epimerase
MRSCRAARSTARGGPRSAALHYYEGPHRETELVRCTRGSIFLVMVELRPGSATRNGWLGVELSARQERMTYVPEGFGQGYQTLEDDTEGAYSPVFKSAWTSDAVSARL